MELDTEMRDRETAEYPDPTDEERTPYPTLVREGSSSRIISPSPYRSLPTRTQAISDELGSETNTNSYSQPSTPSNYFSFGNSTNNGDYFHAYDDASNDGGSVRDDELPTDSNRIAWTQDFFSRLADVGNTEASNPAEATRGGRGRPRKASAKPRGQRRGWKWAIRGTDHADIFSRPKDPRGKPKKRGRRPVGRPRTSVNATGINWIDPGVEFRELQGKATKAWLDGDNDTALEFAKLAVQVNSEVFVAHKMIHDILQDKGDARGAVLALSVGVHTKRDPNLWADVADRILALEDRNLEDEEWARSCYVEAIKLESDCYNARVGKMRLSDETRDYDSAFLECRFITQKWPGDLECAYKFAELACMMANSFQWGQAKEAYDNTLKFYADRDMLGDNEEEQWSHLNIYLDLLIKLGRFEEGIKQLKRLARWFLGRKNDTFWDVVADDREFDITHERRSELLQFRHTHVNLDLARYGDGLPLEIRIKLGLLRMRTGNKQEGFRHLEHLRSVESEVEDYVDMYLEVADCLKTYTMFDEALKYYEPVKRLQNSGNPDFWLGIAQCYKAAGRIDAAETCFLTVAETDENNIESRIQLARIYDATSQYEKAAKMADQVTMLGRINRQAPLPPKRFQPLLPKPLGMPTNGSHYAKPAVVVAQRNASERVPYQSATESGPLNGQASSGSQPSTPNQQHVLDRPAAPTDRIFRWETFHTKRERVQSHYSALCQLSASILTDDDEEIVLQWIRHADAFVDEFKRTGKFYSQEGQHGGSTSVSYLPQMIIQEMAKVKRKAGLGLGVELNEDTTVLSTAEEFRSGNFHGIAFPECHRVFSELAILYAKRVEPDNCNEVLQNALIKPNVFRYLDELWMATQAVRTCCALIFNDTKMLTKIGQDCIIRGRKKSGTATQVFSALGRLSHGVASFYDQKSREWIQEVIESQETGTSGWRQRKQIESNDSTTSKDNATDQLVDPGLLMIAGHQALTTRETDRTRPALPNFLRVLAHQPENHVVNLSIGLTYILNALRKSKRDKDDEVALGQAFFHRYYELRVASGKVRHLQEAEYNLARMWHQLGLTHLAVPGYEKVLNLSKEVQKECANENGHDEMDIENFAAEAAFALQSIFITAGNEEAARAITEKWLVI